uniref:alpha/beta fold hydrolase n=1 Tax=Pararhizobium sp. IMCC3301 TaxID=3067904 RepID=UPI002740F55C|nr:alpha/beta hydrolase [Pararhizobium sp. IMCC3301]
MQKRNIVLSDTTKVTVSGATDGPLLILVRMADRNIGLWDGIWAGLSAHFTLAAVQPALPPPQTFDDPAAVFRAMAQSCALVATELGHKHFHIIGWNGGSHIALRTAVDFSDRVLSCILVGAFFRLPDSRRTEAGIAFMKTMLQASSPLIYSRYWFLSGLSPKFSQEQFDKVETWAQLRASGDSFVSTNRDAAFRWIEALRNHWLSGDESQSIVAPTLILAPELDLWHAGPNVDMARAVERLIPASKMEIIADRGSLYPLEDPDDFVFRILRFLQGVPSADA